jgi:hypothetical protein
MLSRLLKGRPRLVAVGLACALLTVSLSVPAFGGSATNSATSVGKRAARALKLARRADKRSRRLAKQVKTLQSQVGTPGSPGAPGARGSALGYATVSGAGTVDTGHSSNVSQSNVTKAGNAICFNGLDFTPKVAIGNVDLNFAVGYTLQTNSGAVGGNGACPGNEQASAVEVNSSGSVVNPVTFYIAFY